MHEWEDLALHEDFALVIYYDGGFGKFGF